MDSEIKISMTSFIDFSLMPNSRKLAKVRSIKNFNYSPATDYWKQLREEILYINKNNFSPTYLRRLLRLNKNNKKNENYKRAIAGYLKFYKRYLNNGFTFFEPKADRWEYDLLSINVNPELGFIIDGKYYLIKLYFKELTSPSEILLNASRAEEVKYLMWTTLSKFYNSKDTFMCFLNVSKGQLVDPKLNNDDQEINLTESAKSFISYWNRC